MSIVFEWTGFICLMLVVLSGTYVLIIYSLDYAVRETRFLSMVSRRFQKWHKSFPKRKDGHRYAATVYDYDTGSFNHSIYFHSNGLTDEECEKVMEDLKRKLTRPKEGS